MSKMVRVRPEIIGRLLAYEEKTVAEHGYLWLGLASRKNHPNAGLHWYKSLATGYEHCWYDIEVEEADDEQTANAG